MNRNNDYYFFPLGLLHGFLDSPSKCCEDVINWLIAKDIENMHGGIDEDDYMVIDDELTRCYDNDTYMPCGWRVDPQECDIILRVYNKFANETNTCFVSISRTYFDNIKEKGDNLTEWERVVFLGYVALKSIEGRKRTVCKANNALMFKRMACCVGIKSNVSVGKELKKYSNNYYMHKLRNELQSQFHNVKIYATHTRGFYFTTRRDISRDKVVECALKAKKSYKETRLQKLNKACEERVKASLELS